MFGLIENMCAALRTGKVTEKAMNAFRRGGALNLAAELIADGLLTDADLAKFLGTVRVAVASEVKEVVFPPLTPDQQRVKALLGDKFVSVERYAKALRLMGPVSEADLAALAVIPWSDAELLEEIKLGAVLIPHIERVTLPFLRKTFGTNPRRQPCFQKDNDWWKEDAHKDLRDHTLPTGWRLVRTQIEPNSTRVTWDAQSALVPATYDRTWTLEVAEMCLLSYRIWNNRPLENMYAWCQDLDGGGYRARAGRFDRDGLRLNANRPSYGWHAHGLLLSRKPSQR